MTATARPVCNGTGNDAFVLAGGDSASGRGWIRRGIIEAATVGLLVAALGGTGVGRDRPYSTADLIAFKWGPAPEERDTGTGAGTTDPGGPFSKEQIERFRCTSAGTPTVVDISCNTTTYNQDWNPDNEIAVAVNPTNPNHIVAGSNDYFYRFNNSTGARQALVPDRLFRLLDGGATWIDGQIPMRSGNGAGDPATAFDRRHGVALMAQLENTGGLGSANITQGDVSVSRSTDGGVTWSEPVTVFKGQGAIRSVFYDKEWMTVDNNPSSPFYGCAYVTVTRFLSGQQGAYEESPI